MLKHNSRISGSAVQGTCSSKFYLCLKKKSYNEAALMEVIKQNSNIINIIIIIIYLLLSYKCFIWH